MHKVHITLQELQAVALMLSRIAYMLSGQVAALHLDNNSTAKAYLCYQGGTASLSFKTTCKSLNLVDRCDITHIPVYIPTHCCTLVNPLPLGAFRLNAFIHPWTYQMSYVFLSPVLVPLVLSKLLGWRLSASHSSQYVEKHSSYMPLSWKILSGVFQ